MILYRLKGVRFATLAQTSVIFNRLSPSHPLRISRLRKEEEKERGDIFQLSGNVLARIQEAESESIVIKQFVFFSNNPSLLLEPSQFLFLNVFDNLQVFHVSPCTVHTHSPFHLNAHSTFPLCFLLSQRGSSEHYNL